MNQTALYFPAFIPSEQWLKDALLYWDTIASIVPASEALYAEAPELRFLAEEQLYEQVDPTEDVRHCIDGSGLVDEFKRKASSPEFAAGVVMDPNNVMHMSLSKATHSMQDFLEEKGWIFDVPGHRFLVVPSSVGLLWVSLLAKYLAGKSYHRLMTPCTDLPSEFLTVFSGSGETVENAVQLQMEGLFPKANPDASLLSIVEFRKEHRLQLVSYRSFVREQLALISKATSSTEFRDAVSRVQDSLELKRAEFDRLMGNLKDSDSNSLVSAIFGVSSPAILGTTVGLAGLSSLGAAGPIAGAIGGASISAVKFALDWRVRNRDAQNHPLAFLHSATQAGVVA